MKLLRFAAACLAAAALSGCGSLIAPPYSPDYQALDRLKRASVGKVAVAPVQPRDPAASVNHITLRGARMNSPRPTYAHYLEDALVQDLREAGVLDPHSPLRIEATIVKNEIDVAGIRTGTGTMEVDLAVIQGDTTRLRKTYLASTNFESSFAGAVAIPKGQIEYPNLVKALLGKVYADIDFINALKN